MKKNLVVFLMLFFVNHHINSSGVYLWEYMNHGERSCCLSLSGADYCNPNVACTKHVYSDLSGIYDYLTRLLNLEKTHTFSYVKMLTQAQYYIRHAMYAPMHQLRYRNDVYRDVVFFHEITDKAFGKVGDKVAKGAVGATAIDKSKLEDVVWRYMVKLGLTRPHKR